MAHAARWRMSWPRVAREAWPCLGFSARGAQACRGELDSARGWEGSGEEGRERVLREQKEKDKGEGAGRPARHVVAMSLRADILGVRA